MLRTIDLVKTFAHGKTRVAALRGVSIEVKDGEIYGIIGRSGAGKSTLIRCLNLLERPTSGRVVLDDIDLTTLAPWELRAHRRDIGVVFQHFHLLHSRTVLANVTFPLEVQGVGRRERRARAQELLEIVGLADRAGDHPSRLSGGQKQRVGIARALAGSPRVLLCDEATSALDSETTDQILALLKDVNTKLGVTIVIITHEMSVVRQICGSAALLEDGRVVDSGRLIDLAGDPHSVLGAAILPFGRAAAAPGAGQLLLTFTDALAASPALSQAARDLDIDVGLVSGGVERIAEQDVGRLRVVVTGRDGPADLDAVARYLSARGLRAEVLRVPEAS